MQCENAITEMFGSPRDKAPNDNFCPQGHWDRFARLRSWSGLCRGGVGSQMCCGYYGQGTFSQDGAAVGPGVVLAEMFASSERALVNGTYSLLPATGERKLNV